jgi:DNA-binding transcriptional ArsR family regulator
MSMKQVDKSVIKIATVLKALGHPIRIEILRLLSARKKTSLAVKEIHESLGLSQPETSKHLIVLRKQSILLCERKEGHSLYMINDKYSFIQNIIDYLKQQ